MIAQPRPWGGKTGSFNILLEHARPRPACRPILASFAIRHTPTRAVLFLLDASRQTQNPDGLLPVWPVFPGFRAEDAPGRGGSCSAPPAAGPAAKEQNSPTPMGRRGRARVAR